MLCYYGINFTRPNGTLMVVNVEFAVTLGMAEGTVRLLEEDMLLEQLLPIIQRVRS